MATPHTHPSATPAVPARAGTILVPVANPSTAPALLALAAALVDAESDGRVAALVVLTGSGDAEANDDLVTQVREMVDSAAWVPGVDFELLTRDASTVARGILDAADETGADMILLGVTQTRRGDVSAGPIAEAVMSTAHADVVVARLPLKASIQSLEGVVVAVDGSDDARIAAQLAVLISGALATDVVAVHVQGSEVPRAVGFGVLEASVEQVAGHERISPELIVANDVASGVLSRIDDDDLVVLGTSHGGQSRHWLTASVAAQILRNAPGPVLMVSRRPETSALDRWLARLRPRLTRIEQESVVGHSERLSALSLDYVVLAVVAGLLASFGLLQNSAAVVIGAMLVAPLLGPLTAVSVGLITARLRLARRAAVTALLGSAISVGAGMVLGLVIPLASPTSEMLARTSPTLLDAGVALAAGVVGAYATVRKDIPAALAGVAIAAALVPPLCTVGLMMAAGEMWMAAGALLLFATNISSVVVTGALVFAWLGMRPPAGGVRRRRLVVSSVISGVLTLGTIVALITTSVSASREAVAARDVESILPGVTVTDLRIDAGDPLGVSVTVLAESPLGPADAERVERGLEDLVGTDVAVDLVVLQVVRPPE